MMMMIIMDNSRVLALLFLSPDVSGHFVMYPSLLSPVAAMMM